MSVDNPPEIWNQLSFQYTEDGGKNWFFWSGKWIPIDDIALPCITDDNCNESCKFYDLRYDLK